MDTAGRASRTREPVGTDDHQLGDLLARIADGDQHGLQVLYQLTSARIYGLVRKILTDPVLSEETVQTVYLQIWHSADKFVPALGSPLTWMITIAHRRAVDKIRSVHRSTRTEAANEDLIDHDVVAESGDNKKEIEAVSSCLASLTGLQRQSITMAYYDGFTYRQVAEELDLPLPAVKSLLCDGLDNLRSCLQK